MLFYFVHQNWIHREEPASARAAQGAQERDGRPQGGGRSVWPWPLAWWESSARREQIFYPTEGLSSSSYYMLMKALVSYAAFLQQIFTMLLQSQAWLPAPSCRTVTWALRASSRSGPCHASVTVTPTSAPTPISWKLNCARPSPWRWAALSGVRLSVVCTIYHYVCTADKMNKR